MNGLLTPKPIECFKKKTIEKEKELVEEQDHFFEMMADTGKTTPKKLTSVQRRAFKNHMVKLIDDWIKTGKLGEEQQKVNGRKRPVFSNLFDTMSSAGYSDKKSTRSKKSKASRISTRTK